MVLVMAFLFAVIAPFIFPFAALFFMVAYLVFSHNAMHVYVPQYETGGIFFFPAMRRFLGALVATQLTLVAYLMLKRAWGASLFALLCPLLTRYFDSQIFAHFERSCNTASVEGALSTDLRLRARADGAPRDRRKRLSVLLGDKTKVAPQTTPPESSASGAKKATLQDQITSMFDPHLYRQPLFDDEEATPDEPEDVELGLGAPPPPPLSFSPDRGAHDAFADEDEAGTPTHVAPAPATEGKHRGQAEPLLGDVRVHPTTYGTDARQDADLAYDAPRPRDVDPPPSSPPPPPPPTEPPAAPDDDPPPSAS